MDKVKETRNFPVRRRCPKPKLSVDAEPYYSKTIGRALDVLDCFSERRPSLSLTELTDFIDLPKPSLYRVLMTLESHGYLTRSSDGAYSLASKLLFGRLQADAEAMIHRAHPELQKLANAFDEATSIAYLLGARIEVIDTIDSFHEIRAANRPGRVIPPHCSALGKAIVAFQEQTLIDRMLQVYGLIKRTENTIVDRQLLLKEFERIRAEGHAVDREEAAVDQICVGVPIRFQSGRVVASLSISSPKSRMSSEREKEMIQAAKASARAVAEMPQV